jgi:hypothetical protein
MENDNEKDDEDQEKRKTVARDFVELKHVEVKKQEISQETEELAKIIKQKELEEGVSEELSNDEVTILENFQSRRLFLSRIAIITNQSRIPLGIEPFKKADLESLLNGLIRKGFVKSELVRDEIVYFLTEKGKERVQ